MKLDYEEMRNRVIAMLDLEDNDDDTVVRAAIDRVIDDELNGAKIAINSKFEIHKTIYDSIRGLGVIEELLADPEITEIMINGTDNIFVEKHGEVIRLDKCYKSEARLEDVIQQIVAGTNKRVNEADPIVDTRLMDGSRVNIVLPPVSLRGAVVTIRKFPEDSIDMENLIRWKSISREAADFLKDLVKRGYNIFVSGGTGSGKTTFLNALSNFINDDERIITIEDSAELQLKNIKNLVTLETRSATREGTEEISIRDLIKTSLRMRPDRIIVGEVRGSETLDMLQAMNTGHDGSMSTGHANSPKDMLSRLETMVLMGMDIPLRAVRSQIASGIDILIHLGRMPDKTRKVIEIDEIVGMKNDEIVLSKLYELKETDGELALIKTKNELQLVK